MNTSGIWIVLLAGVLSWMGTEMVRRSAVWIGLLQPPNFRSSHGNPTPHGGGVGIVVAGVFCGSLIALSSAPNLWAFPQALLLSCVVAFVGFIDDLRQLPALLRLGVQIVLCGSLVVVLGMAEPIRLDNFGLLPLAAVGLLLVMLVWWVNLFNFMDGIDGIAGAQAVYMFSAGALLVAWSHPPAQETPVWIWSLCLVSAAIGFLIHNWPPARIFMGDVGSTYLAFMIAFFALTSVREGWLSYESWLILGALFVSDASVTLLRRMITGQRWLQAHRSHAYQRLARRLQRHRPVTLLAITVNCVWLTPLAWASLEWRHWSWFWVGVAYTPLLIGVIALGAGRSDNA